VQDSISAIGHYAKVHGISFPILKDVGNVVAVRFGAVRTPEVFVLDQERVVRYWGRIDDQYGVGYTRPKASRRDLAVALEELLAGKPVSKPVTESAGCFIGRVQKPAKQGEVTYAKHIAPILQKRCVECHRPGEIAPFSLTSYDEVIGWTETIREVIQEQRMPPWQTAFDAFAAALHRAQPKVDRVCLTTYSDGKLKVERAAYPGDVSPRVAETGFEQRGKFFALAQYALFGQFTTHSDLKKARGLDMSLISKTLASSVHVPVVLEGRPATVNFWSKDGNAFSQDTHAWLRAVGEVMARRQ
jgi:hypothetical protein